MSANQETIFRYLALLQLIPRYPGSRDTRSLMQALSGQGFQVSMRMLQRDLDKLSGMFPLICDDAQKPYKWSFDRDFKSNLPALDTPKALTLVLAEQYLKQLLPHAALQQLQHEFESARRHLEALEGNRLASWTEKVMAVPEGNVLQPAECDEHVWQTVTDALISGRALEVRYLSRSKSEMHDLTLHPQGIVVRYRVTYLLAMADDYVDVRQFALHRIQSACVSEQPGRVCPDFRLRDYVHRGAFGYPMSPDPVVLRARVRPAVAWLLRETPLSDSQVLSSEADAEGWYQLEVRVPDDRQTQWWLQSMGAEIDVLEPRTWRDAIHRQARQILGQETGQAK